jgi:predicted acetyltransferase
VDVEVRAVGAEALPTWVAAMNRTMYIPGPLADWVDYRRATLDADGNRFWAAVPAGSADAAPVGTLRSFASAVSVPGGGRVAADAVTAVTVGTPFRRRGILRAMMGTDLAAAKERGDTVAVLVASEYPIYGRFGFGVATESAEYRVDVRGLQWRDPVDPGRIEPCTGADLVADARRVDDVRAARTAGALTRDDRLWDLHLGLVAPPGRDEDTWFFRSRAADGTVDGWLRVAHEERWERHRPQSTLVVRELQGTTVEVERRLWAFVSGFDLIATVQAEDRAVDEPLPLWVRDARAVARTETSDFLWLRPLDLLGLCTARTYGPASVVVEVVDPDGYAGGRVRLDGDGATPAPHLGADVTLAVDDLAALALGRSVVGVLADAGRIDEHTPGALTRLAVATATLRAPWCDTWF